MDPDTSDISTGWLSSSAMFYGKIMLGCFVTSRMIFDSYYFARMVVTMIVPAIMKKIAGCKSADLLSEHSRTGKPIVGFCYQI